MEPYSTWIPLLFLRDGPIQPSRDELKDLAASAKAAKDDRADEAKLYSKANKDLGSTIKAVEGCINCSIYQVNRPSTKGWIGELIGN